jgi:glycyl-tRNA synthetase
MRKHFVLADPLERKESILKQIKEKEKEIHGKALCLDKVLSQVVHLTEWPTLIEGSFNEKFLTIPKEVLICEMVEHQKYFPIEDHSSHLLQNRFLITADNTPCPLILKGNEKVLSARLSDGVFLYEQDVKVPMSSFIEKLKTMTFQQKLGSMWDKVSRLQKHIKVLHELLPICNLSTLERASFLCKADLASTLVAEFPELQGTIGKYYSLAQKEDKDVALAIEEHWMPLSESANLPSSPCGILLSIADKIDNLIGYFSVGLKPSSSSDPYALRRQTFGILKMLIEGKYSVSLEEILKRCSSHFPKIVNPAEIIEEILSFMTHRAKSLFEDFGYKKDEMDASLQGKCIDPFLQLCKVQALHSFRLTPSFTGLYEVYKRSKGFLDPKAKTQIEESLFSHPAEKTLFTTLVSTQKEIKAHLKKFDFFSTFQALSALQPPLSSLLDQVKIVDPDPAIRAHRTSLVNKVFELFEGLLDFSKIQEL